MKTKSKTMRLKKSKLEQFLTILGGNTNFGMYAIHGNSTSFVNTESLHSDHIHFLIEITPMKKYHNISFGVKCSIDVKYFGDSYKQLGITELTHEFPSLAKFF